MSISDYMFTKPQFCDVAQHTVLYMLSSMLLSKIDGGKRSFIPNVKKGDYVEYFIIDLVYEVIAKNSQIMAPIQQNLTQNPQINYMVGHSLYMVAIKSIFDRLAHGNAKLLDNVISIGIAEGTNGLVDHFRSKM